MSESNEQEIAQESTQTTTGPGRHLREARESRKLSVDEVAAQLRMQVSIIEALEADDYSAMPGTTFVQGYLRSYSRLLGLSEENIIALSQSDALDEPQLVSTIAQGKAEASSRDLPFRIVTFLILLVVLLGIGWWLVQREPTMTTLPSDIDSGTGVQGLAIPLAAEMGEPVDSAITSGEAKQASDITSTTPSYEEAPAKTMVEEVANPEVTAEIPTVAEEVTVSPQVEPLTPEMPQSSLTLEYQADCWSVIKDAAGRRLAFGTMTAGKELELQGEAPFEISLGYASGVTMYYNGELYDHRRHHKGNVARFKLGSQQDNRPISGN